MDYYIADLAKEKANIEILLLVINTFKLKRVWTQSMD